MGEQDAAHVRAFIDNDVHRPTLGLLYGRRRIGKSTMLVDAVEEHGGFYFEATRVETPVQLDRLGRALGDHLGVGRIALADWEEAVDTLIRLGGSRRIPVVLDEFGHIAEADRSVDSIMSSAFGSAARKRSSSQARVVLCGSAIALMRSLTAGEAPLRGRAGMELIMHPDDYRIAATRLPRPDDLMAALQMYAVIGGVVGYATDMVDFDLPDSLDDIDRWIVCRVLSPAATLHREATTLLAEDQTLSGSGSLLHHSILGAIANGSVTAGSIARVLGKAVSNLAPALGRLIDAGFVLRHEDPIRNQRPTYALDDPYLQFHYAVLEPHGANLRDRNLVDVWADRLRPVFRSQVRGPVFEQQARTWVRRFASDQTLSVRDFVGPSHATAEGKDRGLDVVVAGPGEVPAERVITALGEAKAGETMSGGHLHRLELLRSALGARASDAKLLLFGVSFDPALLSHASSRPDVEIIDLERLYYGS